MDNAQLHDPVHGKFLVKLLFNWFSYYIKLISIIIQKNSIENISLFLIFCHVSNCVEKRILLLGY